MIPGLLMDHNPNLYNRQRSIKSKKPNLYYLMTTYKGKKLW